VLVSCHEDFVGAGLLEPQWVYETRPSCLSFLRVSKAANFTLTVTPEPPAKLAKIEQPMASSASSSSRKRLASDGPAFGESAVVLKKPARQSMVSEVLSVWETVPRCLDEIGLEVRRALPCEWQFFREYHYKDHSLSASAACWVGLVDGHPVAFTAAFPFAPNFIVLGKRGMTAMGGFDKDGPKPSFQDCPDTWMRRVMFREHRTVVLPDYQGTGIGSAMSDAVARDLEFRGNLFTSQTIHPFFGSYRERSPFWRSCASNRDLDSRGRPKFSHYWVGATLPNGDESKKIIEDLDKRVKLARGT